RHCALRHRVPRRRWPAAGAGRGHRCAVSHAVPGAPAPALGRRAALHDQPSTSAPPRRAGRTAAGAHRGAQWLGLAARAGAAGRAGWRGAHRGRGPRYRPGAGHAAAARAA
nr:hypothetical protein [Tanacetum cinerariifolium]